MNVEWSPNAFSVNISRRNGGFSKDVTFAGHTKVNSDTTLIYKGQLWHYPNIPPTTFTICDQFCFPDKLLWFAVFRRKVTVCCDFDWVSRDPSGLVGITVKYSSVLLGISNLPEPHLLSPSSHLISWDYFVPNVKVVTFAMVNNLHLAQFPVEYLVR